MDTADCWVKASASTGVRVEISTPTPHCPLALRQRTARRRTGRTYSLAGSRTHPTCRPSTLGSSTHTETLWAKRWARLAFALIQLQGVLGCFHQGLQGFGQLRLAVKEPIDNDFSIARS